jgi:hypothetical protein
LAFSLILRGVNIPAQWRHRDTSRYRSAFPCQGRSQIHANLPIIICYCLALSTHDAVEDFSELMFEVVELKGWRVENLSKGTNNLNSTTNFRERVFDLFWIQLQNLKKTWTKSNNLCQSRLQTLVEVNIAGSIAASEVQRSPSLVQRIWQAYRRIRVNGPPHFDPLGCTVMSFCLATFR